MRFSDLFKNFTSFTFAMVPKNSKFMQKSTKACSEKMDQYYVTLYFIPNSKRTCNNRNSEYRTPQKRLKNWFNFIPSLFFFSTDSRYVMPKDSSNDNQLYQSKSMINDDSVEIFNIFNTISCSENFFD